MKDLIVETETLSLTAGGSVLSPGNAEGRVVHLPRLVGAVDETADCERASVIDDTEGQRALTAAFEEALRQANEGPVVVVADYPSLGIIPLVSRAAGFVFRRGSLLCHTAIVLRERGVPALVVADAFERLPEGSVVRLTSAGVELAEAAGR